MEQIGRSLDHFLDKVGLKKQFNLRQFFSYWPKVVGDHINNYTRPLTIKENILWVEVTDSTWLYHLTMIKLKIIADFNAKVGGDKNTIKDIKFVNADFHSKKYTQVKDRKKLAKKPKIELQKVAFLMKEEDKKELESVIQHSPPVYQPLLQKMFQTCYLQQRLKEERGAKVCKNCNIYVWEHEIKEGLCPCCFPIIESWIKLLKILYHREPWLHFEDIVLFYPFLDRNVFLLCKRKILDMYSNRMIKIMEKKDLDKKLKRKILSRLAQRYIMIAEEKKPEEIESELVFKTLKPFPGLYQYLYN